MPGHKKGPVPVLRIFGITEKEHSVCMHVHGFTPYFFVPAAPNFDPQHCGIFRVSVLT